MRQCKRKSVTNTIADLTVTSGESMVAWGALCGKVSTGVWNKEESEIHINKSVLSTSALSYIGMMGRGGGGPRGLDLFLAAKSLWEFALENNITLTVDYLPGGLQQSFRFGMTHSELLQRMEVETRNIPSIQKNFSPLQVDLFACRINFQLNKYIS